MGQQSEKQMLGPWMTSALVVGNIIGAGIFLLPASLAPFGQNAIYGWLLTIAGALSLSWVFAQFASRIDGGPYAYVRATLGELPAFLVMWSYWISIWTGFPVLAIAAVSYASSIVPALGGPTAAPAAAIGAVWLLTIVNMGGARTAGAVQLVTTVLKILPLIAVAIVAGVLLGKGVEPATPIPAALNGGGIASAAALAFFSMLGFEAASLATAKVRNAARVVPIATLAGTAISGFVYLIACMAVIYLIPGDQLKTSAAPFADAIVPLLGPTAGMLVAVFAIISALGCLNGWVLCAGEVPLTLARDGVFPRWLGVTTAIGTPVRAQVITSLIATVLIVSNYSRSMAGLFTFMVLVTTAVALVLYVACAASALAMVARGRIKAPMLAPAAAVGLLFSLWIAWGVGAEANLWGLGLMATGLPIYAAMRFSSRGSSPAAVADPALLQE